MRKHAAWTCCLLLAAAQAHSAQVMILGTWHMDGAGHDLHNLKADDVLLPRRQAELGEVAEALLRFRPTRIAVESPAAGVPLKVEKYNEFRDGTLAPSRNEVVQLGFRVAELAALRDVWGIDESGELAYAPVQRFAQRRGTPYREHLDALNASVERMLDGLTRVLRNGSVADGLRYVNDPARIAQTNAFYTGMQQFSDAAEQPGPQLLADWQQRNAAICANLTQLTRRDDRVLVVFGSGHAYLLRECVRQMRGAVLVEVGGYLSK